MSSADEIDVEHLRMHLAQAYTRAIHPDVVRHLHEALRELDDDAPPGLVVCNGCSQTMLPDRLDDHPCCPPEAYPRQ